MVPRHGPTYGTMAWCGVPRVATGRRVGANRPIADGDGGEAARRRRQREHDPRAVLIDRGDRCAVHALRRQILAGERLIVGASLLHAHPSASTRR